MFEEDDSYKSKLEKIGVDVNDNKFSFTLEEQ